MSCRGCGSVTPPRSSAAAPWAPSTDRIGVWDVERFLAGIPDVAVFSTRISLLTPYRIPLAQLVAGFFEGNGITIDRRCTFDLVGDLEMSAVEPDDIARGAEACMAPGSEALFISCTGLRTNGIIDDLERRLGCPVFTSNQALSWECLRAAGYADPVPGQGRLMREA